MLVDEHGSLLALWIHRLLNLWILYPQICGPTFICGCDGNLTNYFLNTPIEVSFRMFHHYISSCSEDAIFSGSHNSSVTVFSATYMEMLSIKMVFLEDSRSQGKI